MPDAGGAANFPGGQRPSGLPRNRRVVSRRRTALGSRVICNDRQLIYEETPQAYKSVDSVVHALQGAGLIRLFKSIRYEAMRASGPGGQHVNTTDSAIRATHLPSGLSVRVQTERSQHANKRVARALLVCKLAAQAQEALGQSRAQRRVQHHQVERGNAGRVFSGEDFRLL